MRYALSVSVVAVLLSACGGSSPPLAPTPGLINSGVRPLLKSKTFQYTGHRQLFLVPQGVKSITIVARGAQGGGKKGGLGGRVYAVIPVSSQETLYVFVGGRGKGYHGGFNGGGDGGRLVSVPGYGGGGASDIRSNFSRRSDRIIVAGGGGGEGKLAGSNDSPDTYDYVSAGGKGGGSTGGTGEFGWPGCNAGGCGGSGGSQDQGGSRGSGGQGAVGSGNSGRNGSYGKGGKGGAGCHSASCYDGEPGGGGGGGYYGGGGGGAGGGNSYYLFGGGGGGGGSSYIESNAKKFQSWQGWKNAIGDGLIVISWK